jgi:hypothetical protein
MNKLLSDQLIGWLTEGLILLCEDIFQRLAIIQLIKEILICMKFDSGGN